MGIRRPRPDRPGWQHQRAHLGVDGAQNVAGLEYPKTTGITHDPRVLDRRGAAFFSEGRRVAGGYRAPGGPALSGSAVLGDWFGCGECPRHDGVDAENVSADVACCRQVGGPIDPSGMTTPTAGGSCRDAPRIQTTTVRRRRSSGHDMRCLQTVARHGITSRISPSGISRPTEAEETAPEDRHGRDQDSEQDEQDFFMRSSLSSQPSAPMRASNAAWLAQLCLGRRWGRGEVVVSTEG